MRWHCGTAQTTEHVLTFLFVAFSTRAVEENAGSEARLVLGSLAVVYGLALTADAIEGQTVPLMLPAAVLLALIGLAIGRNRFSVHSAFFSWALAVEASALVAYGVAAFAVLQIVEPVMHGLHWPEGVLSYVVVALAAGFPIVVALAWIFDVRGGRLEKTEGARLGARRSLLLVAIGALAAAPGLIWYFGIRGRSKSSDAPPSIVVLPFVNLSAERETNTSPTG